MRYTENCFLKIHVVYTKQSAFGACDANRATRVCCGCTIRCICSAQSKNRYNFGLVLRKVGILTLSGEVGILTLRRAIPELLLRKVGIGTK